jgi:Domain of unknown function (DUF4918)
MIFSEHVLAFNKSITLPSTLPDGVDVLNPYHDPIAFDLCTTFYRKFYSDSKVRTIVLGINPGRFGGGLTGIPFTDPVKLAVECGIPNTLLKKAELSADFIYKMIAAYGGPRKFYQNFYISAVCPLGFTKDAKNLNYYDIKELQENLMDFIVACLNKQLAFGIRRDVAFILGEGENFKFFKKLNDEHNFFQMISPLPHPRFIMQYRRKDIDEFVQKYIQELDKFKGQTFRSIVT